MGCENHSIIASEAGMRGRHMGSQRLESRRGKQTPIKKQPIILHFSVASSRTRPRTPNPPHKVASLLPHDRAPAFCWASVTTDGTNRTASTTTTPHRGHSQGGAAQAALLGSVKGPGRHKDGQGPRGDPGGHLDGQLGPLGAPPLLTPNVRGEVAQGARGQVIQLRGHTGTSRSGGWGAGEGRGWGVIT
jgi:hypothetical protein